ASERRHWEALARCAWALLGREPAPYEVTTETGRDGEERVGWACVRGREYGELDLPVRAIREDADGVVYYDPDDEDEARRRSAVAVRLPLARYRDAHGSVIP